MEPSTSCPHRQAHPVTLTTGELVACVCVECLAELPADYIAKQLLAALLQATCSHEAAEHVMSHGSLYPVRTFCTECLADVPA